FGRAITLVGNELVPTDGDQRYGSNLSGAMYALNKPDGIEAEFAAGLHLPQGARVTGCELVGIDATVYGVQRLSILGVDPDDGDQGEVCYVATTYEDESGAVRKWSDSTVYEQRAVI